MESEGTETGEMSSSLQRSPTLTDMPPEILSRICELLLPDRSLDRARKEVHQVETVNRGFKWTGSLPYGFYFRRDPRRCDGKLGSNAMIHHDRESSTSFVKVLRSIQQPYIFNDLANFARTCKLLSNAARDRDELTTFCSQLPITRLRLREFAVRSQIIHT